MNSPTILISACIALALLGPGDACQAQLLADFESLSEGFRTPPFTTGGITFSQPDGGIHPEQDVFALDNGSAFWEPQLPPLSEFVSGKVLQINAFTPGPDGVAWARFHSLVMSAPGLHSAASLDVAYVAKRFPVGAPVDYTQNVLTLEALRNGKPVAASVLHLEEQYDPFPESPVNQIFGAGTVSISGVQFDQLRLTSSGPADFGHVFASIDNVFIGDAPSNPADLNGDGQVNGLDLGIMLSQWLSNGSADLNNDGLVNGIDLGVLLTNWT